MMDAQALDIEALQIGRAVGHVQHPSLQPTRKAILGPRLLRIVAIERVVALEISLHRRRVRATGLMNDCDHLGLRKQYPIWIAEDDARIDELLAGDDHLVRSQPGLLGDTQRPPDMRAPQRISPLHM